MGRHSAPDGEEVSAEPLPARTESATQTDLRMLRENPAVRARCIAAAVVPFLLYSVVLIVLGRAGDFLLWVWIPIVAAGILVGAMLDLGHRDSRG
ncbi:MAG: hypothetical protein M3N95_12950 [Actinomycetota bacterium]|nr:hypothetical protein [Actinomycetota bacterium]